jgi:hypothetical protein
MLLTATEYGKRRAARMNEELDAEQDEQREFDGD